MTKCEFRFHMMFVGREWQGMFVEAREKVVKSVNLVKCLKRDIEKWTIFDPELMKSLIPLKVRILHDYLNFAESLKFLFPLDLSRI